MAFSVLDVSGLSLDDVIKALEKATGQIITCIDEVKEQQHILASTGMHMRGHLLTSARLLGLNEVQKIMVAAKEMLRRV